ncbi:alpha/beta hydrolase [Streptomyces pathocidini]|uniref:Alpha/beta hydrolase n=1 Tax=Streptomyces pathocidini TaxID=1650571 RepID=A0ABW7UWY8_9ACTN
MSSFPELGSTPTSWFSTSWFGESPVWRALLALTVVFVLLATTGWTAIRNQTPAAGSREAAVAAWQDGSIDGRGLPDLADGPRVLADFFSSLTTTQQEHLVQRYPLVVGNMGGAPVELRYRANRIALDEARSTAKKRMNDLGLTEEGRQDAGRLMHRFESMLSGGRQILAFDPTGPGRAAEVFGDLAQARQVSVVVPGVDTNLVNFERTQRKYSAPVGMARALYEEERAQRPEERTAVVAWADYTTPAGLGVDAATGRLAEDGAVRLDSFVDSLAHASRVSLFCHSYGSVVCGVAARDLSPKVTDIAVAGSPGMRAETVAGLRTKARVWAARDADDWIQDVPYLEIGELGHGADPVSRAFGARVISASRAVGHTGYFEPGTESLESFAEIGVGALGSVDCAAGHSTQCQVGIPSSGIQQTGIHGSDSGKAGNDGTRVPEKV